MNYQKHYDSLMKKAQSRVKPEGYTERHHIMPRSMGGSDDKSNLVDLTAREHFVAHYLFAKVHGGKQWNAVAMFRMSPTKNNKRYINSRLYAVAKENNSKEKAQEMVGNKRASSVVHTQEFKNDLSERMTNNNHMKSEKHRERMKTEENPMKRPEIAAKLVGENNGFYGKKHKEDSLKKMSESRKGKATGANNPRARDIRCVETGVVFHTMGEAVEFAKTISSTANRMGIGRCVRGVAKAAYGYHWEYA